MAKCGLVSTLSLDYNRLLLCGDVNLHFEKSSDLFAKQFLQHLSDFDFLYHVAGQTTHQRGGSLDVVCTQGLTCKSLVIEDTQISDHYPIYFESVLLGRESMILLCSCS